MGLAALFKLSKIARKEVITQAATPSISTVTEALTNGLTTIGNNLMSAIGSVLPIALPILGAVAVVGVGISIFNRVRKGRGG